MSKIDVIQQNMVEWYVTNFYAFENHLNGKKDAVFHQTRKEAIDSFARLGFPTPRTEQWKYTRLTPLLKHKFAPTVEAPAVSPDTVHKFAFAGSEDRLVVFVNGRYSPELSTLQVETGGVLVGSLEQALEKHRELVERHFSRYADYRKEPFVALNTAYALDGAFVYLAEGVELERPIHLLFLSDGSGGSFFANPRNLIILERNAGARIIESYHGLGESPYFTNGVTEVVEADQARLDHVKIQEEGSAGFHIYNLQVHMGRESVHRTVNVDLGGRLVRNNLNLSLMGEYGEGHLNGLYVGSARQHIDNHTFMDHAVPHCESNELYKGILSDKATGVFNGKILVRPDAQKTNAYQNNRALLLSDDARVNSKPELEIFADDVRCTHGASIGQLDEEALFYLRSRGIPEPKAHAILRFAFANDVLEQIPDEAIREQLSARLQERFSQLS